MVKKDKINILLAETYHEAALPGTANMKSVAEILEYIRNALMSDNSFNIWNNINFSTFKIDSNLLKKMLINLKIKHTRVLYQSLSENIREKFIKSPERGLKYWFQTYLDSLLEFNTEICDPLCNEDFAFPETFLPILNDLKRLNRLIYEGRWIDAFPDLQNLANHKWTQAKQKAYLEIMLGEIEIYYLNKEKNALTRFQKAEKRLKKSSRLKRVFAEYYQKAGDLKKCRQTIFEAIVMNGNDMENYLFMGDTYREEENFEVAEKWYRDAIKVNFLIPDSYLKIITLYGASSLFTNKQEEIPGLIKIVKQVTPDNPFNSQVYNAYRNAAFAFSENKAYPEAISFYEKAIRLHPRWTPAYTELAYILGQQNNFKAARAKVKQALQIDDNNFNIYFTSAWLEEQEAARDSSIKAKHLKNAIKLYKKCLSLQPSSGDLLNTVGVLYGDLNDYKSSKEYYQKAIAFDPANSLYHSNLAFALNHLQDFQGAKTSYAKAIELKPEDATLYNKLGNVLFSQSEFKEAISYYLKAIEYDSTTAVYFENLGLANKNLGKIENALKAYETSLSMEANWSLYNNTGILYYQTRQYNAAINAYKKAIELKDNDAVLYDNLGLAYEENGDMPEAEKSFLRSVEIKPDNYLFQNRLGVFYSNNGKYEQSIKYFKKAGSPRHAALNTANLVRASKISF